MFRKEQRAVVYDRLFEYNDANAEEEKGDARTFAIALSLRRMKFATSLWTAAQFYGKVTHSILLN